MLKKLLCFAIIFVLSACGFTPVYTGKKNENIIKYTQEIAVAPMDGKSGVIARERLRDQLSPYGLPDKPEYNLTFNDTKVVYEKRGIRPDGTATWGTVVTSVGYKLTKVSDGSVLLDDKEYSFTSYNILSNVYSATVSEEQAAIRGANMIADQIATRIMAYFKNYEGQ